MVDDPVVKAELQVKMLTLTKTPVPGYKAASVQLYGSAANPVVVDDWRDSDEVEEDMEDQYDMDMEDQSDESEEGDRKEGPSLRQAVGGRRC